MISDEAAQASDPSWLLTDLTRRVRQIKRVVLVSADGLKRAASDGLDRDDADRLAAATSSLWATVRTAGEASRAGTAARQVVAEFDEHLLFVCAAGEGSVLLVVAQGQADAGLIGYEMGQLTKRVREVLQTPARRAEPDSPGSSAASP